MKTLSILLIVLACWTSLATADDILVLLSGGEEVYNYTLDPVNGSVSVKDYFGVFPGLDITTGNILPNEPGIEIGILRDLARPALDIYNQDGNYVGGFYLTGGTTKIACGNVLPVVPGDEIVALRSTSDGRQTYDIYSNFDLLTVTYDFAAFWTIHSGVQPVTAISAGDVIPDGTLYTSGNDGVMGTDDDVLVPTPGDEIVGLRQVPGIPGVAEARTSIDVFHNAGAGYIAFWAFAGTSDIAVGNFLTDSNHPGDEVLGATLWRIDVYDMNGYIKDFWVVLTPQLAVGNFGLYQAVGLRNWAIDYYNSNGYQGGFWALLSIAIATLPSDADKDGVPDNEDLCPNTPAGVILNSDGCSMNQVLDEAYAAADTYKNHGDFVSTVAAIAEEFEVLGEDVSGVVSTAAKSTIGMPRNSQKPGKGN